MYTDLVAWIQFDASDLIHHICCYSSVHVSFAAANNKHNSMGVCIQTRAHVSKPVCVLVDDLDSRWVNSQVCPSFSGRIRSR